MPAASSNARRRPVRPQAHALHRGAAGRDPQARRRAAHAVARDRRPPARSDAAAARLLLRAALPLRRPALPGAKPPLADPERAGALYACWHPLDRIPGSRPAHDGAAAVDREAHRRVPHRRQDAVRRVRRELPCLGRARRWAWWANRARARSTLGRVIVGLLPATGGRLIDGQSSPRCAAPRKALWRAGADRSSRIPFSLNPRMTVRDIVAEPLRNFDIGVGEDERDRRVVGEALDAVGLRAGCDALSARILRRPAPAHRHRPRADRAARSFIVRDEPVSALDVSIQAQILNLLQDLQRRARPDLPVHRPRPRGREMSRPRGGDVSRQDRARWPPAALLASRPIPIPRR